MNFFIVLNLSGEQGANQAEACASIKISSHAYLEKKVVELVGACLEKGDSLKLLKLDSQQKIEQLEKQIQTMEGRLVALQIEYNRLIWEHDDSVSKIRALRAESETLKASKQELTTSETDLRASLNEKSHQVLALRKQLETLESAKEMEICKLKTDAEMQIAGYESRIANLNVEILNLRHQGKGAVIQLEQASVQLGQAVELKPVEPTVVLKDPNDENYTMQATPKTSIKSGNTRKQILG